MLKLILFMFAIPMFVFSQIGIGTNNPKALLDVNGSVNVKNQLYLGGSDTSMGNPGVKGQILVSNGVNPPTWQDVKLPDGKSTLSMSSKFIKDDIDGIELKDGVTEPYAENSSMSNLWTEINKLSTNIVIINKTNKVTFSLQTIVQRSNSDLASYACAIFIDDKLKAVRPDVINTTAGGYKTYNMSITLDNLEVGNHVVKVACRGRNLNNSGSLGIGKVINDVFLSSSMAKSIFSTVILEPM